MEANVEICRVKTLKILITGGPGTGKTSVIKALEENGHKCLHEISREITQEAQKRGIEQLFLKEPLLFSKILLKGRIKQFEEAENDPKNLLFFDRGIPDILAYMNYSGNAYPPEFHDACRRYIYDKVYILPPWKNIYTEDNERYETFEQAVKIHDELAKCYRMHGYCPVEVPSGTVAERTNFILGHLE